jgi:hypothetical protein
VRSFSNRVIDLVQVDRAPTPHHVKRCRPTVTLIGGTKGMRTRSTRAIVLAAGVLLAGCQGPAGGITPHSGWAPPLGSTGTVAPTRPAPGSCHVIDGEADVRCTPGAINPDVTEATIGTTICVPGWTAKIRPPAAYTNLLKTSQMIEYGQTGPPSTSKKTTSSTSGSAARRKIPTTCSRSPAPDHTQPA